MDNALSGVGGDFADLTGADWRLSDDRPRSAKIAQWFNPAAFRQNALGTPGNGGRNKLQVPGTWNLDYSLFKRFELPEKTAFELRGEFFNVLNHPNIGAPSSSVVSATFGRITSAAAPRIIQVSARLTF